MYSLDKFALNGMILLFDFLIWRFLVCTVMILSKPTSSQRKRRYLIELAQEIAESLPDVPLIVRMPMSSDITFNQRRELNRGEIELF
jgi:hypothetical protein